MTDPEPPSFPIPAIINILADLVECLCVTISSEGAGEPCWCGVVPGQSISWEQCSGGECASDSCGMTWVRPTIVFPYTTFPQPLVDPKCVHPLGWAVEVGSLRCMPVHPDGEPLTPDESMAVTWGQILDARAMYTAIKCCPGVQAAVESYQPIGPQGGCVGGFWTAYLEVPGF